MEEYKHEDRILNFTFAEIKDLLKVPAYFNVNDVRIVNKELVQFSLTHTVKVKH
jgi:hypothetical protein